MSNPFADFAEAASRPAGQGAAVAVPDYSRVAVLGGGVDARLFAALCLAEGAEVTLFSAYGEELEAMRQASGIALRDAGPVGTYQVDRGDAPSVRLTAELDAAVKGAEAVFLTGPVHKQRTYAMVLADHLRDILGVAPGDSLTVEVLEGNRAVHTVPIAGFVEQYFGLGAYMQMDALNRLLQEGPAISGAYLMIDDRYEDEIVDALEGMPRVGAITSRQQAINNFYESIGENWLIFALFITFFAGAIAFGVVYNSARIALSERGRELASLRILGFTRAEISYILLGELAVLTLAAIPVGFLIGWALGFTMLQQMATEMYRIPLNIQPSAYAIAAVVVIASAVLSGLIVRRRLNRLDLIEVLKTRE